jgi:hypothetical protein
LAHPGQFGPPQSTSVSLPFWTPSLHVGTAQAPAAQTPLTQSLAPAQPLPSAHLGQFGPPQSMSVSPSFWIPSLHVGAGAAHTPAVQTPLRQSFAPAQPLPSAHLGQFGPPQSTSVSPSFWIPSLHVGAGATQTPAVQTPLRQSFPPLQPLPSAHLAQWGPPQSTSVSLSFLTPSLHVAGGGVQVPLTHVSLAGQALPHEPQWLGLLASATHPPAQAVMPEGHVVVHTPLAHTWPVAQVLPQAPQLSGSLESDTHVLEQFVCSDEQWAWHLP